MEQAAVIAKGQAFIPVVDEGRLVGVVTTFDFDAHDRLLALLGDRMDQLVTEIADDDEMFYGQRGVYFAGAAAALSCIRTAMAAAGRHSVESVLDLPCGHGRVMRMLRVAFPHAHLTACDVNRDGVDFCARTFDATPVHAPLDPTDLAIDERFDLIWVGSLFTHLDRERWVALLDALESLLVPGGLVVFTTLGLQSANALRAFNFSDEQITDMKRTFTRDGFAYCGFAGSDHWGITLNSPEFVRAQIGGRPDLILVDHAERAWTPPMPAQDVFACVRR